MDAPWLNELNPAQRQAATHGAGPVLVIAGAGTGKTKTLAGRVAFLLGQGVEPQRILLLTFTRRAAAEMLARAARLAPPGATSKVWGGTFHATANRLLRQYGRALGLAPEFSVLDQADAADLMNLIRGELLTSREREGAGLMTPGFRGLNPGLASASEAHPKRRFPRKDTLMAIYGRVVNSRTPLAEVLAKSYPWCADDREGIRQVFERYTARKRDQNVLDYDDLLLYWKALCLAPRVGALVAERFEHILVDEYQDTNLIQAEILQAMRRQNPNIMVVGDDAQSIYSFRAATVRNILDFPTQFPGAQVITLEQNYRSTGPILDAANAVMAHAAERYTKNLFSQRPSVQKPSIITCADEAAQCDQVCGRVLEKLEQGIALRRQAVLFRAGHHSDMLEVELTRRNIPFVKYGGLKFIEAAHIKDMLAVLRLLDNPGDEMAWFRVLQLLEGVGPGTARRIMAGLGLRGAGTVNANVDAPPLDSALPVAPGADPLRTLLTRPPMVPPVARLEFSALREAVAHCLGVDGSALVPSAAKQSALAPISRSIAPAAQVQRIRRFYEPIFQRLYDNPAVRLRDLDQLEQIASGYSSRSAFVTDLTLDPPSSTQDLAGPPLLEEDYLVLSTIHSAKGCEWDVVHIIHAADGMMPSDMATGSAAEIDEERRLFYVAMTRARDTLSIYFPLRYYFHPFGRSDRHSYAQLTRFLAESDLALYERIGPPAEASADPADADAPAPGTRQAIDRMLSALWKT